MAAQDDNLTRDDSAANVTDEREARPKFWIAAYTRPHSEKKAADALSKDRPGKDKIETYVPVQTVVRQWSDRKKKIDVAVIPMVIFAKITKDDVLFVKQQPLINKVLSFPGNKEPAAIPEEQIENLRLMLSNAETPVEFVERSFNLADSVRVKGGKLEGLIGKVERIDGNRARVIVSIDMLGGAMVEIDTKDIEILK